MCGIADQRGTAKFRMNAIASFANIMIAGSVQLV
jgi:hypothetical protein